MHGILHLLNPTRVEAWHNSLPQVHFPKLHTFLGYTFDQILQVQIAKPIFQQVSSHSDQHNSYNFFKLYSMVKSCNFNEFPSACLIAMYNVNYNNRYVIKHCRVTNLLTIATLSCMGTPLYYPLTWLLLTMTISEDIGMNTRIGKRVRKISVLKGS